MPRIVFVDAEGKTTEVVAEIGQSVMSAAVQNGIDAIAAECGGSCACGTCHCYIDAAWSEKLPAPDYQEQDMIECVVNPDERSRLSCQIAVSDALDGLVVHLPAGQY
ncbi:2Fe-2S iron-sulfur cluster binding domain-containing protein [Ensifer sp. HO-A22]|uniref:2Fe-2S iron-sulfur cluster binding domain-containing protein n=1 Tax=Ensifer oleiphilus TaxID=2742698 RepID=A0A7Y6QBD3_9HYPH|nr:2Fe-2S iron-sulfur cluster-binding protein [Ensifer oleiphilus]NVD42456.1 2Fe-2S iron-sulfur cluster binding domain-containing protein [Ensifer oleiphilus]